MDQTFNSLISKSTFKAKTKTADPWEVIPVKNLKYAKDTIEVHLGKREAEQLVNFQKFENLQNVWINQNWLTNLWGLEKNFRIKHLYAQKNKINSIKGVIQKLKHLETLILYDNQLRDLESILTLLKPLTSLRHLQMFQNPIAQQPNYKYRVLAALPKLEIFDRHKITQQQKQAAIKFMKGKSK